MMLIKNTGDFDIADGFAYASKNPTSISWQPGKCRPGFLH